MLTCKLALQSLRFKHEWLAALGYKLLSQPEGFSPAALLSRLLQDPAFRYIRYTTTLYAHNTLRVYPHSTSNGRCA